MPQLLFICKRRFADAGRGVERHLQRRHGQLAADHQRGPPDADPTLVDLPLVVNALAGFQRQLLVVGAVEEADDFAVDANRRGIQMSWPKTRVMRSAMLVLPLPGAP